MGILHGYTCHTSSIVVGEVYVQHNNLTYMVELQVTSVSMIQLLYWLVHSHRVAVQQYPYHISVPGTTHVVGITTLKLCAMHSRCFS